jgi:hypothetical protein
MNNVIVDVAVPISYQFTSHMMYHWVSSRFITRKLHSELRCYVTRFVTVFVV